MVVGFDQGQQLFFAPGYLGVYFSEVFLVETHFQELAHATLQKAK